MGTWKKTDEAWFGDTFNRDATLCSCTIDGVDSSSNGNVTTCNTDLLMSGITYASGSNSQAENTYAVATNINGISPVKLRSDDLEIKFESITNKLKQLQAQIDTLKKRPMVTSELRSALKTLHYKREVE